MNYRQFFKRLLWPHFPVYFLGILLLIAVDALQLWVPKLLGAAIDDISLGKTHLASYVGNILLLGLVILVCKFGYRLCILGQMRKSEYLMRDAIVKKSIRLPVQFYEKHGPGKIMALLINDVTSIRIAFGLGMLLLVDAIFLNGLALWMMASQITLALAVRVLLPMPLILLAAVLLGRVVRKRFRHVQDLFSNLTEYTQELFLGLPIIKSLVEEVSVARYFATLNEENMQGNLSLARVQAVFIPMMRILPMICYAVSLFICGRLVINDEISVGDFVAINGYIGMLIMATMGVGGLIAVMNRALGSYDRLREYFEWPEEQTADDCAGDRDSVPAQAKVRAEHLTFTYPEADTPALCDVNLTIPEGAFVGFVGAPGSGKTTFFKLLLRLYNPPSGTLFINDKDVRSYCLEDLRALSGFVPQEQILFSKTVADNITFPAPAQEQDMDYVQQLMDDTAISLSLQDRLQGPSSKLQEAGTDLSGGQRQRIGIARALYKRAPLLLLDDVFSALDFQTAAMIEESILKLRRKYTILFISQRIDALRDADIIFVFKDGHIVEQGTHEELWNRHGEYYVLYHQQEA